jgi:hypothetical protein
MLLGNWSESALFENYDYASQTSRADADVEIDRRVAQYLLETTTEALDTGVPGFRARMFERIHSRLVLLLAKEE